MPAFPAGFTTLTTLTSADRFLVSDDGTTAKQAGPATVALDVYQAHGNTGSTETIDLANGTIHSVTLDANCTFTFSGAVSGNGSSFTLIVTQDGTGSRTATWPAAVKWASATAPTLSTVASRVDMLTFVTVDGGTTWYGALVGTNFA